MFLCYRQHVHWGWGDKLWQQVNRQGSGDQGIYHVFDVTEEHGKLHRSLITACGKGAHPKEKGGTGEPSPSASHCLTAATQAPFTLFQVPLKYHSYHTVHTLIHAQEYLWLSLIPKSKPMAQQTGTSAFHTKQLFPVFNCIISRFLYAKFMQTNAILANSFVSIFMTTDTCIMQCIYPTEEKDKHF